MNSSKPRASLRYGVCPAQLQGVRLSDNAPFYFRSRGDSWTLRVGPPGEAPNFLFWGREESQMVAFGEVEVVDADDIDMLVGEHLGTWRHVDSTDQTSRATDCSECDKQFVSDGQTVCTDCLVKILGF